MTEKDTFESWTERVVRDKHAAKPLNDGEVVKAAAPEQYGVIDFVKLPKNLFLAEIGKKGDKYIYHFYPDLNRISQDAFFAHMEEALLQVFKNPEQIEQVWEEPMKAYAVRVTGWTKNVWGDDLAIRVVSVLDEKLSATS